MPRVRAGPRGRGGTPCVCLCAPRAACGCVASGCGFCICLVNEGGVRRSVVAAGALCPPGRLCVPGRVLSTCVWGRRAGLVALCVCGCPCLSGGEVDGCDLFALLWAFVAL